MATLVLELVAAAAKTSEKCAVSLAVSPKALRLSVTMSDTIARSSPEAAASCSTPSMPWSISLASHPAIAIYPMASALSLAVNFVVAPSSLASAARASISWALAPDNASTVDIASSKSPAPSTQATKASVISRKATATPAAAMAWPAASKAAEVRSPKLAALSAALSCSAFSALILDANSASFPARFVVSIPASFSRVLVASNFWFCRSSASSVSLMRCSNASFCRSRAAVDPVASPICFSSRAYRCFRLSSLPVVFSTAACCF